MGVWEKSLDLLLLLFALGMGSFTGCIYGLFLGVFFKLMEFAIFKASGKNKM